jgi:hypothetical protein
MECPAKDEIVLALLGEIMVVKKNGKTIRQYQSLTGTVSLCFPFQRIHPFITMVNDDKKSTLRKRTATATKAKHNIAVAAGNGPTPLTGKLRRELPDVEFLLKYGDPSRPTPPSEKLLHLFVLLIIFGISFFLFHHFYFRHVVPDNKFTLPQARVPN